MDFGPKPASRAAQSVVLGFFFAPFSPAPAAAMCARTVLPSTHHKSQSIRPCSSRRIRSRSSIRSKSPPFRHRLKRSYTVFQGPYRSGRSRHGEPLFSIHMIPFITSRCDRYGRPLPLSEGNRSPINSHCSSVNSYLRIPDILRPTILPLPVSSAFWDLRDRT